MARKKRKRLTTVERAIDELRSTYSTEIAELVFEGKEGRGIVGSLVEMNNRKLESIASDLVLNKRVGDTLVIPTLRVPSGRQIMMQWLADGEFSLFIVLTKGSLAEEVEVLREFPNIEQEFRKICEEGLFTHKPET